MSEEFHCRWLRTYNYITYRASVKTYRRPWKFCREPVCGGKIQVTLLVYPVTDEEDTNKLPPPPANFSVLFDIESSNEAIELMLDGMIASASEHCPWCAEMQWRHYEYLATNGEEHWFEKLRESRPEFYGQMTQIRLALEKATKPEEGDEE